MTTVERLAAVLDAAMRPVMTEATPERRPGSILAAVSGGADSTALLYCLNGYCDRYTISLMACHFNHGLRTQGEHVADEAVVRKSCEQLGVPLITDNAPAGTIRALASTEGSGIEAAARSVRYRFFNRAAVAVGAGVICTGHTEDDQVETVLMAIKRGVDLLALSGIPERRMLSGDLILLRPFLSVRKRMIREFLRERGASWREDSTNAETVFERNRIRHKILPELESTFPAFRERILTLQHNAEMRRRAAEEESRTLTWASDGDDSSMEVDTFFQASRDARLLSLFGEARRRGMLKPSSRISVGFFAPLLGIPPAAGTIVRGRGSEIRCEGGRLYWSSDIVRRIEYGYLRSVTFGATVELPNGTAVTAYSCEKEIPDGRPSVVELKGVREPLVVRSHRIGDHIETGGGRKSVASLLAARRVPRRERHLVPVVCDRDGVVAVLIGGFGSGRDGVARRPASGGVACTLVLGGVNRDG